MTNTIAEKLVDTLDGIVDIGLDEEGTPGRPYAVYTLDVAPVYTKDGLPAPIPLRLFLIYLLRLKTIHNGFLTRQLVRNLCIYMDNSTRFTKTTVLNSSNSMVKSAFQKMARKTILW